MLLEYSYCIIIIFNIYVYSLNNIIILIYLYTACSYTDCDCVTPNNDNIMHTILECPTKCCVHDSCCPERGIGELLLAVNCV